MSRSNAHHEPLRSAARVAALVAIAAAAPLVAQDPAPGPEGPTRAIELLLKEIHRGGGAEKVALAKLVGYGTAAVPPLLQILEEREGADQVPVLEALSSLGEQAEEARPTLEAIVRRTSDVGVFYATRSALAGLRVGGRVVLCADYAENRLIEIGVDDGKRRNSLEDIFGACDIEWLPNGNWLVTEFPLNRVRELTVEGREVWAFKDLQNPFDADPLPGRRVLIADTFGERVIEIDRAGTIEWQFTQPGLKPYDVERLANGRTLIADGAGERLIEIDMQGKITLEIPNLPSVHDVDAIDKDHFLLAQRTLNRVVVIDRQGVVLWKVEGLKSPSDVDRLPNGNWLVSENGGVREIDDQGETVWSHEVVWAVEANHY